MNRLLLSALLFTIVVSCTTSVQEKETENPCPLETAVIVDSTGTAIDSVMISSEDNVPFEVTLDCRLLSGEDADNPLYVVSLRALNRSIPLDTIHKCSDFTRGDYAELQIPDGAISACGGWYKGTGEYFYLTEQNTDLVVRYVWLKEEMTTNRYPYREVYRLKLPDLEQ